MRKFTPVTVNRAFATTQAREPYEDFLELEGRVYQLEKDMELISTFVALAAMVGLYFAIQYYQKYMSKIDGVVE